MFCEKKVTTCKKIGQKDLFCDTAGMQSFVQYNKYGFTLFHIEKMQ